VLSGNNNYTGGNVRQRSHRCGRQQHRLWQRHVDADGWHTPGRRRRTHPGQYPGHQPAQYQPAHRQHRHVPWPWAPAYQRHQHRQQQSDPLPQRDPDGTNFLQVFNTSTFSGNVKRAGRPDPSPGQATWSWREPTTPNYGGNGPQLGRGWPGRQLLHTASAAHLRASTLKLYTLTPNTSLLDPTIAYAGQHHRPAQRSRRQCPRRAGGRHVYYQIGVLSLSGYLNICDSGNLHVHHQLRRL